MDRGAAPCPVGRLVPARARTPPARAGQRAALPLLREVGSIPASARSGKRAREAPASSLISGLGKSLA